MSKLKETLDGVDRAAERVSKWPEWKKDLSPLTATKEYDTFVCAQRRIEEMLTDLATQTMRLMEEREEARRLFDKAMEYADSAYNTYSDGPLGTVKLAGIIYAKPRPVAPWEGEK